jgi:hypothetical protein
MSGRKRTELICGLAAGVWGLLLLLGAYLQPYGDSRYPGPISLHPGFTPIEYPYLAAFGVPLLGIALGAIADGVRPSAPARVLLVIATVVFTGEAVISIASIGLFLMPAAALGITASILSFTPSGTA